MRRDIPGFSMCRLMQKSWFFENVSGNRVFVVFQQTIKFTMGIVTTTSYEYIDAHKNAGPLLIDQILDVASFELTNHETKDRIENLRIAWKATRNFIREMELCD